MPYVTATAMTTVTMTAMSGNSGTRRRRSTTTPTIAAASSPQVATKPRSTGRGAVPRAVVGHVAVPVHKGGTELGRQKHGRTEPGGVVDRPRCDDHERGTGG